MTRTNSGIIDVHHHFCPEFLMRVWAAAPVAVDWADYKTHFASPPYTDWTPEGAVALLDANGIATAVLSLPAGTVGFLEGRLQQDMVCEVNAYATRLGREHPGRFGLLRCCRSRKLRRALQKLVTRWTT